MRKNAKEQALKEFIKAIELEPQDPGPYFELGKIYWKHNDKNNAMTYFDKYIYMGGDEEKVKEIIKFPPYSIPSNKSHRLSQFTIDISQSILV